MAHIATIESGYAGAPTVPPTYASFTAFIAAGLGGGEVYVTDAAPFAADNGISFAVPGQVFMPDAANAGQVTINHAAHAGSSGFTITGSGTRFEGGASRGFLFTNGPAGFPSILLDSGGTSQVNDCDFEDSRGGCVWHNTGTSTAERNKASSAVSNTWAFRPAGASGTFICRANEINGCYDGVRVSSNVVANKNTIKGATHYGGEVLTSGVHRNALFYGCATDILVTFGSMSNCVSSGCTTTNNPGTGTNHNYTIGQVALVDPAAGDLHLLSTSLLIDAGTATGAPSLDLDRNEVPSGAAPDIGAYERVAVPPNVIGAAWQSETSILVTFDQAMDSGHSLTTPGSWTVTAPFGGDAVTVSAVVIVSTATVLLTVSAMGPDTVYRATAPATVENTSGDVVAVRIADFLTPVYAEQESADAWALTAAGNVVDIGDGYLELVPWSADEPYVSLRDAVWISLFSDARVDPVADGAAVLPDSAGEIPYRGGWWADDTFGSKLWLLRRRSASQETINLARDYAREALAWLVTDGVAARVDATTERFGQDGISMEVLISKADGTTEALRFPDLWAEWE